MAFFIAAAGAVRVDRPTHPLWHLSAVVLAPLLIIAGFNVYDRIRNQTPHALGARSNSQPRRFDLPVAFLAGAVGAAAVIHASVCPAHFREGLIVGIFFVLVSAAQLLWALTIFRHHSRGLRVGAALNAAIVVLWLYTRMIGVPIGPEGGRREAVGVLDAIASALEIVAVVLAVKLARRRDAGMPVGLVTGGCAIPSGPSR